MLRKKFTRKKGEIQGRKCIFSFRENRCFKSILFKIKQKKSKQCEANDFLLSKTKKTKTYKTRIPNSKWTTIVDENLFSLNWLGIFFQLY